ncbi:hypothetical protein AMK30_17145 [Streptomyces sp. CB02460]|nr:hypothetical protein AMK30_17145 [Streptomyces sp. CB02460]
MQSATAIVTLRPPGGPSVAVVPRGAGAVAVPGMTGPPSWAVLTCTAVVAPLSISFMYRVKF